MTIALYFSAAAIALACISLTLGIIAYRKATRTLAELEAKDSDTTAEDVARLLGVRPPRPPTSLYDRRPEET